MSNGGSRKKVLLVEPNDGSREFIRAAVASLAEVEEYGSFAAARARLLSRDFDLVVTNIRLDAFNGIHLVYLATTTKALPRAIAYCDEHEAALGREAQRAGAFYETRESLPAMLNAYLRSLLPDRDRRDPAVRDRRSAGRGGGRRSWDRHSAA